jgi:hypothetical protein
MKKPTKKRAAKKPRTWKAWAWIRNGESAPYYITKPGGWTRAEARRATHAYESLIRVTITEDKKGKP